MHVHGVVNQVHIQSSIISVMTFVALSTTISPLLYFAAIPLPSPYHRWSAMNSSVAQVNSLTGTARALNLGITTITAEDTRVAGHMQMSSLHVVIPDSLYLYKLPLTSYGDPVEGISSTPSTGRWYVVVGQQYVVHMKVFSGGIDGHEIHITEVGLLIDFISTITDLVSEIVFSFVEA